MPRVVFSTEADLDVLRFFKFLEPSGLDIAEKAIDAIYESFAIPILEDWPQSGVPVPS